MKYSKRKRGDKVRRRKKTMKGGTWKGKAAGPVGIAWNGGDISSWPGMAGVDGQSNYIPLSRVGVPSGNFEPPLSSSNIMKGGSLKKNKHKASRKKRVRFSRRLKRKPTRKRRGGCGCGSSLQLGGGGLVRGRLFPEDLVNAYRGIVNAPSRWINTWSGFKQPANLNVNPSHQPIDKINPLQFKVGSRINPTQNVTSSRPL